jgi:hypothetical protein
MRRISWLAAAAAVAVLLIVSGEVLFAAASEVCPVPSDVDSIIRIPVTCSIWDYSEFPIGVIVVS